MILKSEIKKEALSLGFSAFGVAPVDYDPMGHNRFLGHISRGYHADMKFLERAPRERFDPRIHLPSARSAIVLAHNYYNDPDIQPDRPYVSIYARGENYHRVLRDKLRLLVQKIEDLAGGKIESKIYVDSAALSEKSLAVRAGLGFIGRNGLLIIPKKRGRATGGPGGSFHFLGVIIINLKLEPDSPLIGTCGECRKCIEACPTDAIVDDHIVDANLCISYHTTQNKSEIPDMIADRMSDNIFGCDICQLVCPYNSSSIAASEPRFAADPFWSNQDIETLMDMTESEFEERFQKSSLSEIKFDSFLRNLRVFLDGYNKRKRPKTPRF